MAAQNAVVNSAMPTGKSGSITTTQWNSSVTWQLVADNLQSLAFVGYNQNMQPTT